MRLPFEVTFTGATEAFGDTTLAFDGDTLAFVVATTTSLLTSGIFSFCLGGDFCFGDFDGDFLETKFVVSVTGTVDSAIGAVVFVSGTVDVTTETDVSVTGCVFSTIGAVISLTGCVFSIIGTVASAAVFSSG